MIKNLKVTENKRKYWDVVIANFVIIQNKRIIVITNKNLLLINPIGYRLVFEVCFS